MKCTTIKRFFSSAMLIAALVFTFTITSFAAELPSESVTAKGLYRHPVTNIIEDSGGESNEALGSSMVGNIVDKDALLETAPDGTMYLSFRMHLMSNISEVLLSVQADGQGEWVSVPYETTATGTDSADLRIAVPGKDAVIRAECKVDAMGRHVVFFITMDSFGTGNPGNFVRTDAGAGNPKTTQNTSTAGSGASGLTTGGSNQNVQLNASADTSVQNVMIGANVWIMFFVLVFCAQLLACFVFWFLKVKFLTPRRAVQPLLVREPEEDFSEDFLAQWEDEDETP